MSKLLMGGVNVEGVVRRTLTKFGKDDFSIATVNVPAFSSTV
jgi:hypothetical protein